jgi:TonB family protein
MITWLHYLLEVNIYLATAYGCYWLLFRKETFYKANRAYLLISTVVCFIIPLIQIGALHPDKPVTEQAFLVIQNREAAIKPSNPAVKTPVLTINKALRAVYCAGVVVMSILLILKLYSLLKSILANKRVLKDEYSLIHIQDCTTPYSFLHFLFTNINEPLSPIVLKHELTHIQQKHSWDILLLEFIKITCWFNPAVYLIQHSLKTLHEFLADAETVHHDTSAEQYVDYLISNAHGSASGMLTNNFSEYKLLKTRIIMLYQKPSGSLARLKYLVAAPVCATLLCASSLAFSKNYDWIKIGYTPKNPGLDMNRTYLPADSSAKDVQLKIVDGAITAVSSKLTVRDRTGHVHSLTAATLTNNEKQYLLKEHKLRVSLNESENDSAAMLKTTDSHDVDTATLENFYKQMGRTIRYPTVAREAGIGGHVTTLIKTDNDGKISDAYIAKGVSEEIDKEVLRTIKSYQEKMPDINAYYSLTVTVALQNANGDQVPFKSGSTSNSKADIPKPGSVKNLSEVLVIGYLR